MISTDATYAGDGALDKFYEPLQYMLLICLSMYIRVIILIPNLTLITLET